MPNNALTQAEQKRLAARHAVDDCLAAGILAGGMRLGLGTGSTAMPAVERIAELMREGKLPGIRAVATSFQTTIACETLGIPVYSLNSRAIGGELDFAIDGADEIDPGKKLIKGGGAALLLEKIVAYNAASFIIVADGSKTVRSLGTVFPLPVEIVSEARASAIAALARLGAKAAVREGVRKAGPVITDNGNLILDCLWDARPNGSEPFDPYEMEGRINEIAGVVENGLFTRNTPVVYVARADGTVDRL